MACRRPVRAGAPLEGVATAELLHVSVAEGGQTGESDDVASGRFRVVGRAMCFITASGQLAAVLSSPCASRPEM